MKEIDPHLPINKVANYVVSKSIHQGAEFKTGSKITSMTRLPTKQWHGRLQDDLTGFKCGRFTVIGCAVWMPKNYKTSTNNTRWVVRCTCGRYQMLTSKAVKKNHNQSMCVECSRRKR